jgi:hypothetical protein
MNGKRQETHYLVASETAGEGEALSCSCPRAEPFAANPAPESPASAEQLMEEVCSRENLEAAWKRVPGTDRRRPRPVSHRLARVFRLLPDAAGAHKPGSMDTPEITFVSLAAVAERP